MVDILFVQNYYEHMGGIMLLSAVLKKHGYTTDVTLGTKEAIVDTVLAIRPKVIGFYCTTGVHHKYLAVAAITKKKLGDQILTLFGGPHPTFVPDVIKEEGVDIICRGEGEYALLELMQALSAGRDYTNIQNLFVKKNGTIHENDVRPLCDINKLPFPDREIYKQVRPVYHLKRQEVMIGRGCPFSCTFCSTHAYRDLYQDKGDYVRFRSVEMVMAELMDIQQRYRPTCFSFHDDTLVHKGRMHYCRKFFESYKKSINLPFSALIRADLVTEDLLKLLKDSGCYFLSFGIESGNETLRNKLLKKHLSDQDILQCSKYLHQYRIPFATFNMVGLPGETVREVWDTIELNIKAKPSWAWFSVYQTLPRTELAQYAVDKAYVQNLDVALSDSTFHENSHILRNNPDGRKILRLKNMANLVIKMPPLKTPVEKYILNISVNRFWEAIDKVLYFIFYYARLTYKQGFLKTLSSAVFLYRRLNEFK